MSEIKTSYELSLERTKDIQPDYQGLAKKNCKEKGHRIFAAFLKDPSRSIVERLREISEKEITWVREGLEEILLQNIVLPSLSTDIERLPLIRTGFLGIKQQKESVVTAFSRIEQLFHQYLQEREQFSHRLKAHFSSMGREREHQLQQQLGSSIKVDISAMPEFVEQLRKGYWQLEENYQRTLRPIKEHLVNLPKIT